MIFDMTIFSNKSIFRLPFSLEAQNNLQTRAVGSGKGLGGLDPLIIVILSHIFLITMY